MRLERYYNIVCQDMVLQITIDHDNLSIIYTLPSTETDIPALQDTRLSIILRMCRDVACREAFAPPDAQPHPFRIPRAGSEEKYG